MLQFASPLPRNYEHIVNIFTKPIEDNTKASLNVGQKPIANGGGGYVDPWLDPSMSVRVVPKQTKVEINVEEPKVDATPDVKTISEPEPKLELNIKEPETPFIVKPVIAPPVPDTHLTQLGTTYMEQRDQMLKTRESVAVAEIKEDVKENVKVEDISQEAKDKQKQLFEEQQAALRAMRQTMTVSETKSKADVEQAMPLLPPNIEVVPSISGHVPMVRALTVSSSDAKLQQPMESLRVDQLKKMCADRGLTVKGNKAELIARLKM